MLELGYHAYKVGRNPSLHNVAYSDAALDTLSILNLRLELH